MPQDRESGVAGNAFGKITAPLIAKAIGVTMLGPNSNEALFHDKRIVIKCAAEKTTSVGVSYKMLERIDAVFGAFAQSGNVFVVLSLPSQIYKSKMRPTSSHGPSAGKVGIVARSVFVEKGVKIKVIHL